MLQCLGSKTWVDIIMDSCSEQLAESLAMQDDATNQMSCAGLQRLPEAGLPTELKKSAKWYSHGSKEFTRLGLYQVGPQALEKRECSPEDVVVANDKRRPAEQSDGTYMYSPF